MKIRIKEDTIVEGKTVEPGKELEVSDKIGRTLVSLGRAVEVVQKTEEKRAAGKTRGRGGKGK